jgi:phosphotransferase system enzyme I (PtsI)
LSPNTTQRSFSGICVSPGIGIGRAFIYRKGAPVITRRRVAAQQVEAEVERFLNTLHQTGDEIRRIRRIVAGEQGKELAQIFDAQLAMLEDVSIKEKTRNLIREKHYSAERAYMETLGEVKEAFSEIENEYLRERVSDVADIESQVLMRLAGGEVQALHSLRANTIILAHDLLPSEMVQLERRQVKGVVLDVGGATSHAAIIARSLRLPTVVGAGDCSQQVSSGDLVVVDGNQGRIHVGPQAEVERNYRSQLRRQLRRQRDLDLRRDLPAVTRDGREITLMANVDVPTEVQVALANGARGVGMYRTEFLYLNYRLPSEEEQLEAYAGIVEALAPHPVVIRTIDLGGDKLSHILDAPAEANPILGWRGIRICLDTPDLFKTQLRALLRAGTHGEVQILLPMISSLDELWQARALLEEAKDELRTAGQAFAEDCKLGIMVEVPSVALMIDQFATEVDLLSLGTNDLTQYALAVDRGTSKVAELYDPFHPAVLRLIEMVAASGLRSETPVSICGEMAGDPLATALLLGLGLGSLSMSPALIPEVKEVIRSISAEEARRIAADCLAMNTGREVRRHLESTIGEYLPFWHQGHH